MLSRALLLFGLLVPAIAGAQGRYTPQGAAQRAYLEGERLREEGDALRARGELEDAREKYAEAVESLLDAHKADPAYIDVYVKLGVLYFGLDRSKEALPILEGGLARAKKNIDLRFWYGQNLLAAGRAADAVPVLEAVARSSERFPEVHLVLGKHWYGKEQYQKARPALERYLALEPEATSVRAQLGNTYFKLRLYAEALEAFEAVRAAWPDKVEVQVNIGNAHLGLKQYQKAATVLEAALRADPSRESALFNLAQSYFKMGRFAEAVPHYRRFVEARPQSFNGRYFLGSALMESGQDAAALAELAQAHRLKPDIAQPAYRIGIIHLRAGRTDEAEAVLKKAAAKAPEDAWVRSALGTVARQRGQHAQAVTLHRAAAAAAPDEARLHANLAISALRAGQLPVAEAAIERALKLDAAEPWIRQAAGSVLTASARNRADADPQAALGLLNRAATLRPGDGHILAARALLHVELGAVGKAQADAEAAAKALPDSPQVRYAVGRALLAKGEAGTAVEALRPAHDDWKSPTSAAALGAALVLAGKADEAVALLEGAHEAWPQVEIVSANRALARVARAMASLPGGGAVRRTQTDLRIGLADGGELPAVVRARMHYAAGINALRRSDGKEARIHLGHAVSLSRKGEGRLLRAGAPGRHLDTMLAYADALAHRYDAALERLDGRGAAQRRLGQYVHDRLAAQHVRAGNLRKARESLDASAALGGDPAVEHNLLVLDWLGKRGDRAIKGWTALKGKVPEADFNLGAAFDARGEQRAAWEAFSRAARSKRPFADQARELADVKQRIYRFGDSK